MKLLFVTPQPPFPPKKGTTLRNAALIGEAARRHEVHLLTIGEGSCDHFPIPTSVVAPPPRTRSRRLGDLLGGTLPDLALRLRSPAAQQRFVALLREVRPDIVQFEAVEAAGAVGPLGAAFRAAGLRPRVVYDAHNAEFALQERIWRLELTDPRRWPFAAYSFVQWRRLRRWEARLCRVAEVIAVSAGDAALLAAVAGRTPTIIPNGVDTDRYAPLPSGPVLDAVAPRLLFVGTLDFRPNVDAVRWFAWQVLPLILEDFPGARFVIAGRDPVPAVRALAGRHVEVVGPVEDDLPLLQAASIVVVPLRSGGGMRFKVVQAMAAGVPVVSTTFGVDGVAARHGEHVLTAETPVAFREAVRRTLRHPAATRRRVERARTLVRERYDWRAILPTLHAFYDRLEAGLPAGARR